VGTDRRLDILEDLFFEFDETGTFLDWNRSVPEVTGYTDADLAEMTATAFFEGADADRVAEAVATVFEEGEATVEARLVTADGERIPYEFRATRLPTEADEPARFAGVGRDSSDRVRAERERLRALDRMGDGFFALDGDWTVTETNERGRAILVAAMGEDPGTATVEGRDLWEAVPEAVGTQFHEVYTRVMETREPETFKEYFEPLSAWFDVRTYPARGGLVVYFHDITERERQRETLENRARVLREIHDVVADRDRPFDERVRALVALGRRELGVEYGAFSDVADGTRTVETAVRADWAAPDEEPALAGTVCRAVVERQGTVVAEERSDGGDTPAPVDRHEDECYLGSPVFDRHGDVTATLCFVGETRRETPFSEWEVTLVDLLGRWVGHGLERERANERLERQNEQLERLVSMTSHDLRNPLNVLEGSVQLAAETGESRYFENSRQAIDRMTELVEDVLTLARVGADVSELRPVDVDELAERCWRSVPTGQGRLVADSGLTVEADRMRLRQLFENLFGNSVEHGSKGRETSAQDGRGVTVRIGALPHGGFYVEDDGPGIPSADRENVFDRGYSSTPTGTGLGLAIVREIADAHGWSVRATEGTDGGARFEFEGATPLGVEDDQRD
jgi:PAS domain S-box-containing protein